MREPLGSGALGIRRQHEGVCAEDVLRGRDVSTKEERPMTGTGAEGPGARRVWFVTGASRGFGLEIVRQVLERGDAVVATARDPRRMKETLAGSGALLA